MRPFLVTVLSLMSAILIFNLHMDIAGFGSGEISPLATSQRGDEWLVSDRDYDQRAWVRARLLAGCPQRVVLGSSTVGTINPQLLTGASDAPAAALNLWLTGPSVEDFEALAQLLRATRCAPALVVVGVDPFLLNDAVTSERWQSVKDLQRDFYRAHDASALTPQPLVDAWGDVTLAWLKFKDLLAYQTTVSGLERLRAAGATKLGPRLVPQLNDYCARTPSIQSVRHHDGRFVYCDEWLRPQAQVDAIARAYLERDVHSMKKWRAVSAERLKRLEGALARLTAAGSRVVLIGPTYHPLAHEALLAHAPTRALLRQLDADLDNMSARLGARWLTLRDPARAGCAAGEFFDSHHPGPSCARKLAEQINALAPAP